MKEQFCNGPVVPIPTFYDKNLNLNFNTLKKYIEFLEGSGINILMSTAGTSQFNLLSLQEIRSFNVNIASYGRRSKILGIPALNEKETINEINYYNSMFAGDESIALMLLYPDRLYDSMIIKENSMVRFFNNVGSYSKFPLFIHGLPIKDGRGGSPYEITSNDIYKLSDKYIGMKEESSTFDKGYELCLNTLNGKTIEMVEVKKDFIFIVAGKSQRRFLLLQSAGAQTFLAGLGNVYPHLDIMFFEFMSRGIYNQAQKILKIENEFFKYMMRNGWHPSLRGLLTLNGFETNNRIDIRSDATLKLIDLKIQKMIKQEGFNL